MRESRTHGSEGGEAKAFPTPIVAPHNFALPNFHVFLHEQWDKAGKSIGLHVDVDARDDPRVKPGGGHDDLGRWSLLATPSAPCSLHEFDSVILPHCLTALARETVPRSRESRGKRDLARSMDRKGKPSFGKTSCVSSSITRFECEGRS